MAVMKNIRAGALGKKVVTFKWNNLYWSIEVIKFDELLRVVEEDKPSNLEVYGARKLKNKPAVLDYKCIVGDSVQVNID